MAKTTIFETLQKLEIRDEFSVQLNNFLIPQDVFLTEECSKQLHEYSEGLSSYQEWAMRMFDSASKIPAGIFYETNGDLGVFDECMRIRNETSTGTINGKYCLGKLSFPNESHLYQELPGSTRNPLPTLINSLGLKFATCLPHACTTSDIKQLYLSFGVDYDIDDINCQSKTTELSLDGLAIFTIVFFGIIVGLMLFSTMYDVYNYYTEQKPIHKLLTAFSVFTNGKKLFSTNYKSGQLTCLHGIRVLFMAGIIMSHRCQVTIGEAIFLNKSNLWKWYENISALGIVGNLCLVDTFLLMSGIVVTYGFSNSMEKANGLNIFKYYCHRYFRLTPPLAAVTLVAVSLLKHLGSGPQWPAVVKNQFEDNCRKYWWSSLLYIQNYVNPAEECLAQAWYLSVDTQLFLLSPIFLISFNKWPKLKPFVLGFIITCLSIILFLAAWFGEYRTFYDPSVPLPNSEYITNIYYPTHTRAVPWFVGFAAGYVIYSTKKSKYSVSLKTRKEKLLFFAYWMVIMGILYGCYIFSYNVTAKTYDRLSFSLHATLMGPTWAIGLCFLIVACVNGYGGFINWALSNPYMQVLSKLSYSMYLLHYMVIYREVYNQRNALLFQNFELMYLFWSDFMYSAILAIFWVLAFEYPFAEIENFIWGNSKKVYSKQLSDTFKMENISANTG